MDQKQLREFESHCIQEEHPFCTAACPITVDVRSFIGFMAKGNLRDARKILDRTMPFPEIIGRICDHPCEQACIRTQIDAPLDIGSLERYCVSNTNQVLKLPKLPGKGGTVLIIGSGLAAMTAGLDLARKGRQVSLYTSASDLGGSLLDFDQAILPRQAIEQALTTLEGYGVRLFCSHALNPQTIQELSLQHDATFFDLDTISNDLLPEGSSTPDPITLGIGQETAFAGGGVQPQKQFSVIRQVEDGRRAALSIERTLQGVSLTAQRDLEGAQASKLYTSLEGVVPQERTAAPDGLFNSDQTIQEAGRCIQCECMECVKQCSFLQHFKEYPKTLVRKIFNNESIVQGTRQANTMINSCSLCNQCTVICPNDFPVAEVCRTAREQLIAANHMPQSAHEFALEDMAFSLSDTCQLVHHQPGTSSSQYLFFPGCQLSGSSPDLVEQTYQLLCDTLEGNVGIMLSCCGIPAHWAGQIELFKHTIQQFTDSVAQMGNPTVITACSSCLSMFKESAQTVSTVSLWEILDAQEGLSFPQCQGQKPMAIFDPCTAREQKNMRQAVRSLCQKMGMNVEEFTYNEELADCCGYGGLMQFAHQELGHITAQHKASRSDNQGLAYCAMCRDNMASSGKAVAHILDFILPGTVAEDAFHRPNPGFSNRHENRARLKEQLCRKLYGETAPEPPPHTALTLYLDDEVRQSMNRRHILTEDIQKVLHHATQHNQYFENPENNHRLAKYRPIRVTYWVEYSVENDGYRIHNSYSHRMILPEDQS